MLRIMLLGYEYIEKTLFYCCVLRDTCEISTGSLTVVFLKDFLNMAGLCPAFIHP
jgi:hypothetical protein